MTEFAPAPIPVDPLPVAVVAALMGVSERHVRRVATTGASLRIVHREALGNNGEAIFIDFHSLPPAKQAAYIKSRPELLASIAAAAKTTTTEEGEDRFSRTTVAVRARALAIEEAVIAWRAFLSRGRRSRQQRQGFADTHRETFRICYGQTDEPLGISVSSLVRWTRAYLQHGRDGLVDGRDGAHRKGRLSFSDEVSARAEELYLRYPRRTIAQCYRILQDEAPGKAWTLPHYRAIYNHLKGLAPARVRYHRHPEGRHKDIRPFVIGDYDSLQVMEMIESDHHQVDVPVNCESPFCEISHFPWITVWYDVRSRMVLDVEIYVDPPNSQHIMQSLHRVWLKHGLNRYCHIDNGADYVRGLGKWGWKHYEVGRRGAKLEACAGFDPESVNRVVGPFGTEAIFSIPGEPQGKIVERFFNTLGMQVYAEFEAFRGSLGERSERAEWLRKHPAELPTLTQLRNAIERTIEQYHERPHRGRGMDGRSPNQVFADEAIRLPRRDPDPAALAYAFWHERVGAQVGRNGIIFHHRTYRLEPKVHAEYLLQKVVLRWHEDKPEIVVVCDAMGRFLGVASDVSSSASAPKGRSPKVGEAIAGRNAFWTDVKAEWEAMHPSMRKRLADVEADEYSRLVAKREDLAGPQQVALSAGGGTVTVVDRHLSVLARQVIAAEARVLNPYDLSAADLALAKEQSSSPQFVPTEILRERHIEASLFKHAGPGSEETDEERHYVAEELSAAALKDLKRRRDEEGMCVFDVECPNRGDCDKQMCFDHYVIVFGES